MAIYLYFPLEKNLHIFYFAASTGVVPAAEPNVNQPNHAAELESAHLGMM